MMTNPFDLLIDTLSLMNINVFVPEKDFVNLENSDRKFRLILNENSDYSESLLYFQKNAQPNTLLHNWDEFFLSYLILYIPEEYRKEPHVFFIVIGPYLEHTLEPEEIVRIMEINQIPLHLLDKVALFFKYTPVVNDGDKLEHVVLHLASTLFQRNYKLNCSSQFAEYMKGYTFYTSKDSEDSFSQIAMRNTAEREFLTALSNGDYEKSRDSYLNYYKLCNPEQISASTEEQQYFLITLQTLCSKVSEQSGVPNAYIEQISSRVKQLILQKNNTKNFNTLANEIIHSYCLLIRSHSMKGYSPVIKDIVSYIDFHSEEDLSLQYFAKQMNMNKTYLSTLFKKETGLTLTEYIHQIRMHKALSLLSLSNAPITSVATACGYNDISHFIRVFKRIHGMSPKQYRKSILHNFQQK